MNDWYPCKKGNSDAERCAQREDSKRKHREKTLIYKPRMEGGPPSLPTP